MGRVLGGNPWLSRKGFGSDWPRPLGDWAASVIGGEGDKVFDFLAAMRAGWVWGGGG